MKSKRFVFALCAGGFLVSTSAALADNGYRIEQNHLDRVQWYKHTPEIQILNTTPKVVDFRTREPETTYLIQIPPMAAPAPQQVVIGAPANLSTSPPGILFNPNAPPPSRFQSNISPRAPLSLPAAPSSGALARVMGNLNPRVAPPVASVPRRGNMLQPNSQAPRVARYDTAFSGSGSSARTTTVKVEGSVIPRGSMLGSARQQK